MTRSLEEIQGLTQPLPASCQETLTDLYAGNILPLCRQADELHTAAAAILMFEGRRQSTALGSQLWVSGQADDVLDAVEVRYSLTTERQTRQSAQIGKQAICLVINGDPSLLAGLFIPSNTPNETGFVVVGGEVNDKTHMDELWGVLRKVEEASKHRFFAPFVANKYVYAINGLRNPKKAKKK